MLGQKSRYNKCKSKRALCLESISQMKMVASTCSHLTFFPKFTSFGTSAPLHRKALSRTLVICMLTKPIFPSQYPFYLTASSNLQSSHPLWNALLSSLLWCLTCFYCSALAALPETSWLVHLTWLPDIGLLQDAVLVPLFLFVINYSLLQDNLSPGLKTTRMTVVPALTLLGTFNSLLGILWVSNGQLIHSMAKK